MQLELPLYTVAVFQASRKEVDTQCLLGPRLRSHTKWFWLHSTHQDKSRFKRRKHELKEEGKVLEEYAILEILCGHL